MTSLVHVYYPHQDCRPDRKFIRDAKQWRTDGRTGSKSRGHLLSIDRSTDRMWPTTRRRPLSHRAQICLNTRPAITHNSRWFVSGNNQTTRKHSTTSLAFPDCCCTNCLSPTSIMSSQCVVQLESFCIYTVCSDRLITTRKYTGKEDHHITAG